MRFREEDGAKRTRKGLLARAVGEGSPQLCGADTELRVLEGGCAAVDYLPVVHRYVLHWV